MKRKHSKEDFDDHKIMKKLRKLERKILRRKRLLSSSSSENNVDQEDENASLEVENLPMPTDILYADALNTGDEISDPVVDVTEVTTPDEPGTSANVTAPTELADVSQELDQDILEILGNDPTITTKYGKDANADLAIRLQYYATSGIGKEARKELAEKYLTPNNCKLIDAPQLNAEIKAALTDITSKRDKYIEIRQKQITTTLSCLTQVLSHLFEAKNKDTHIIKLVMDACKNLCDCQYNDSITRRNFILSTLRKEMKENLQNTKLSNFLFGDNLSETIKTAKAINKSGAELKGPAALPKIGQNKKPSQAASKNWKSPFPTRKPPGTTGAQKTKETAPPPPPARSRPFSSYKQSQPRQSNTTRR